MLLEKINLHNYQSEFSSRFSNFCKKAPLLISFALDEHEIKVIDEATSMVYSFQWNILLPVKKFIYQIKETLIENGCYPIIIKTTQSERNPTPEEVAEEMADGIPIEDTTVKVIEEEQKKYLIDKVVIFKDSFILRDLDTKELLHYTLENRSVLFLRKLRTNKISALEAGNIFFKEARFIKKVNPKEE